MPAAPSPARPELPAPVTADPADPPAQHVRVALDVRLRSMLAHEAGTRSGADIEDLHQMRVAVRRMRASLKAAQPLLDAVWADGLRAELGWLGGALGPVRDLDVLFLRLRQEISTLPERERTAGTTLLRMLELEQTTARTAMLEALDAPRYAELVERLVTAVGAPLPTSAATAQPELVDLVRAEARKLRRAVERAGGDPADEVLHALRIRGKRVRYTGELVEPALRGTATGTAVRKLLGATAALQEVLGDHQDACVAEARLREQVDYGGVLDLATVFVAGRLVERERRRAEQLRGQWREAWEQVDARISQI